MASPGRYIIRPVGVRTIGETCGGKSYNIRSPVKNPRLIVSPWHNTPILPDNLPEQPLKDTTTDGQKIEI